jgi:hypothetical protein
MASQKGLTQAEKLDRFQQLEDDIRHCPMLQQTQPIQRQEAFLNEYIDLGLEMANKAGLANRIQLQESWLKRVYKTLFETTLDLVEPEYWRNMCCDYLYQPLFALKHLYRNHPQGKYRLRAMCNELSVTSRYLF